MKKTFTLKPIYFLLFAAVITFSSCKKDKKEDPAPTQKQDNETVYSQFKASIDGTAIDYKETNKDPNTYESSVGIGGSVSDGTQGPSTFQFNSSIFKAETTIGYEIEFGTLTVPDGGYATDEEFLNFFTSGIKPYSAKAANGIVIYYFDENGIEWNTNGDQSGSSFNFTSIEKTTILNSPVVNYTATFNCKLYDGNGNSKTLTNGSAKLSFQNYW